MKYLGVDFSVFSDLPGSMIWFLTLIGGNSQSLLFQIFYSFLIVFTECIIPFVVSVFVYSVLCFFSLCSLYILVLGVSVDEHQGLRFFPKPCPVLY